MKYPAFGDIYYFGGMNSECKKCMHLYLLTSSKEKRFKSIQVLYIFVHLKPRTAFVIRVDTRNK